MASQPWHVAVLDIAKLADCDVEFGSNSWWGDRYESELRQAVKKHAHQLDTDSNGKKGTRP